MIFNYSTNIINCEYFSKGKWCFLNFQEQVGTTFFEPHVRCTSTSTHFVVHQTNNFWQCLHILYECVFDSFTGTDLALAPTSVLTSLSLSLYLSLFLSFSFTFVFHFSLILKYFLYFSRALHAFCVFCYVKYVLLSMLARYWFHRVNYFRDKFARLFLRWSICWCLTKKAYVTYYLLIIFFWFA